MKIVVLCDEMNCDNEAKIAGVCKEHTQRPKIAEEVIGKIQKLEAHGFSYEEISERFGLSVGYVEEIIMKF
jgi:AraC-like DNA-binding protein